MILYENEIKEWKTDRIDRLKSKTGWVNLAGLYWLMEGKNSFGSDSSNNIVFPSKAPAFCGSIFLENDSLYFKANTGTIIYSRGSNVSEMTLQSDASGNATILESGSLAWFIIKRDKKYGIRLRDYENPRLYLLDSIPSFPIRMKGRITADFIPFDDIRKIEVATVIGGVDSYDCPGKLIFKIGRKECILLPFREGKDFFIIFADKTNGKETYGNGRFLYAAGPDNNNKVVLDFNKAYNPPCAFSPFATCPMPPRENILDVEIEAGEKAVHLE